MVAVDVMGGDFAPQAIIEGAFQAAKDGLSVLLFGPEKEITKYLDKLDLSWSSLPISISEANEVIEMGEEPTRAVTKKKNSSLGQAVLAVKEGRCNSVISAGNSGALMVAATFILGRQEGIERPAIAGYLPGLEKAVFCLDLGANADCKASYLEQFAHLGSEYISKKQKMKNPKVGLLSNGSEPAKGSMLIKESFALLEKSGLNFIGNIEPKDVFSNAADVVVCDGFSGNLLLKSAESISLMFKKCFNSKFDSLVCSKELADKISKDFILQWKQDFWNNIPKESDWKQQGGALLLGVNGTVVVSHGCSNAVAIKNAIKLAWKSSQKDDDSCLE